MISRVLFSLFFLLTRISFAHASEPAVVHAVLFFAPGCGHCHYVMQETLPVLLDQYGDQLQIIAVNVTQPEGQRLFTSAIQMFAPPSAGVPFLVIGNEYLVGSADIPDRFPILIEEHLARGGVDWPDIPGLHEVLPFTETADQTSETIPPPEARELSVWQRVMLDPIGNGLAIVVLFGMIAVVLHIAWTFHKSSSKAIPGNLPMLIPVLCVMGLGVAAYLSYVEITQTSAVCGPVGNCNTVQQSEYARLFGILPIGVLGLIGYGALFVAWLISRAASTRLSDLATLALFAMTTLGTIFSIYLTFLEPFVIGATCAWCLSSAVFMTVLMWLSQRPAEHVLARRSLPLSRR